MMILPNSFTLMTHDTINAKLVNLSNGLRILIKDKSKTLNTCKH